MTTLASNNISQEKAIDFLREGKSLIDFYIYGELKFEEKDNWDKNVVFENCIIENFSAISIEFEKFVTLKNCYFKKSQFTFSYFLGGLFINNCIFENYLDFQAGGHNLLANPIIITNNEFKDFVNFFDCCFDYEVIITSNKFHKGTNLLGKPHNIPVTFEIPAIIKDNIGQLDLNNEGEK